MKAKRFLTMVFPTVALAASTAVWACSAAGPNTHVGMLMSIDDEVSSFTILDAQSNRPVTFVADAAILDNLKDAQGQLIVDFESQGANLKATDVRY